MGDARVTQVATEVWLPPPLPPGVRVTQLSIEVWVPLAAAAPAVRRYQEMASVV